MARQYDTNRPPSDGALMTHQEIALALGVSRQAVQRMEKNALRKLARFSAVFEGINMLRRNASNH